MWTRELIFGLSSGALVLYFCRSFPSPANFITEHICINPPGKTFAVKYQGIRERGLNSKLNHMSTSRILLDDPNREIASIRRRPLYEGRLENKEGTIGMFPTVNLTIVFLMHLGSYPLQLTSASIHRGVATANVISQRTALSASALLCNQARPTRGVDIYVHIKHPCHHILASTSHIHIHDVIDFKGPLGPLQTNFTATIFASEFDMILRCKTHICSIIPHHFNLDCKSNSTARKGGEGIGLVGTSYNDASIKTIEDRLGLTLVREIPSRPCHFFRSIHIAIAWKGTKKLHYEDAVGGNSQVKPAERYTNPIYQGIPTIGYRGYHSFSEYGNKFLCGDLLCVRVLIQKIERGQVKAAFKTLHESVTHDTGTAALVMRYLALFQASDAIKRGFPLILLQQRDFLYNGTLVSHTKRWERDRKYWKQCSDLGICERPN